MHKFVILVNGKIETYSSYEDIPQVIDNVIEFLPHVQEPPHSENEHEQIEQWNNKLKELLKRETNGSNY